MKPPQNFEYYELLERRFEERRRRERTTNALQLKFPDAGLMERLAALAGTTRDKFDEVIKYLIESEHELEAIAANDIPHRQIASHARELVELLKTSNRKHLSYLLSGRNTVAELIEIVEDLAKDAQFIGGLRMKKLRLGRFIDDQRRNFVEELLSEAINAGGRLTLNRSKESGSLFKVIKLLKPFLPKEISRKLSFSTQRRIYDAWLKKEKNRPQK